MNVQDNVGTTPLHLAAGYHKDPDVSIEIVTTLVKLGAQVDARDKDGYTPLHLAAGHNENPEVITTLLELGADPRARTSSNATPWDLMEMNDKLKNTPVYWQLNKLRF